MSHLPEAPAAEGPTLCFRRTISWERRIRPWSRAGCGKETTGGLVCRQSPRPRDLPAWSQALPKAQRGGRQLASEQQLHYVRSGTSAPARLPSGSPSVCGHCLWVPALPQALHLYRLVNRQTPHNAEQGTRCPGCSVCRGECRPGPDKTHPNPSGVWHWAAAHSLSGS